MPKDRLGWLLEKRGKLMSFYGWSERYVLYGISGAKSWAYFAYAVENEARMFGSAIVRTTDAYVAKEIKRRLKK